MAGWGGIRYGPAIMDDATPADKPLRRVGVTEGILHLLGATLALVLLAQPFKGRGALVVMGISALIWILLYATFRLARVRTWFGAWDVYSFAFVWS